MIYTSIELGLVQLQGTQNKFDWLFNEFVIFILLFLN